MTSFRILDVFTDRPFGGNQLAVFPDARGIDPARMQRIAREFNFSETTFVLPAEAPGADVRVRIFTPGTELPFAGHPTIGTAYALVLEGRVPFGPDGARMVLQEGVGNVPVEVTNDGGRPGFVRMEAPLPSFRPVGADASETAAAISLDPADVADVPAPCVGSSGNPFLFVGLRSIDAVRRARPDGPRLEALLGRIGAAGIYPFAMGGQEPGSAVHGRLFAPGAGIPEDPATGSAAPPLGVLLVRERLVGADGGRASFVVEQGFEMGRPSLLHVEVEADGDGVRAVRVGGRCVAFARGSLEDTDQIHHPARQGRPSVPSAGRQAPAAPGSGPAA
jgi:trans-2,3-dihydro-3-hydroxyanthranilate isomerase